MKPCSVLLSKSVIKGKDYKAWPALAVSAGWLRGGASHPRALTTGARRLPGSRKLKAERAQEAEGAGAGAAACQDGPSPASLREGVEQTPS